MPFPHKRIRRGDPTVYIYTCVLSFFPFFLCDGPMCVQQLTREKKEEKKGPMLCGTLLAVHERRRRIKESSRIYIIMGRVGRDRREKIRKKREKRNKIKKEEAREEERKGFFRLKSTHSTIEIKARKKREKINQQVQSKEVTFNFLLTKKKLKEFQLLFPPLFLGLFTESTQSN